MVLNKLKVWCIFALLVCLKDVLISTKAEENTCGSGGDGEGQCKQGTPMKRLWNGVEMPMVGFGTAAMRGSLTERAVSEALEAGFRHFDGAEAMEYYDDDALGRTLKTFDGPREELFVVTKLHPKNLGTTRTAHAVENMFRRLQTNYIDLVLIHAPRCWFPACEGVTLEGSWKDSWRVLESFYDEGKIRALGVSNFDLDELEEAVMEMRIKPHVIQNWMDPFHQDRRVREFCAGHDIAYTAYSTLGGQWEYRPPHHRNLVQESPILQDLAEKYGTSISDVVLRWAIFHQDAIVLPRSTNPAHIRSNAQLLQGAKPLDPNDARRIDDLDLIE